MRDISYWVPHEDIKCSEWPSKAAVILTFCWWEQIPVDHGLLPGHITCIWNSWDSKADPLFTLSHKALLALASSHLIIEYSLPIWNWQYCQHEHRKHLWLMSPPSGSPLCHRQLAAGCSNPKHLLIWTTKYCLVCVSNCLLPKSAVSQAQGLSFPGA